MVSLINRLPQWVPKFATVFAASFGFIASLICSRFIVDSPLSLTLAQSACFLPFWICVFWPSLAAIRNAIINKSISGFAFGTVFLLTVGGLFALSFARDIYRSVAAEVKLRDTTGASKDLIQAMHEQANELTSLALTWVAYGLGIGVLALVIFGFTWIRRSFLEIAAIKESPKLDKAEIFVVGDRG